MLTRENAVVSDSEHAAGLPAREPRIPRNMPGVAQAVGARIRKCRDAENLKQDDISRSLKISRSAVAQWESGTTTPSLTSLIDMARLLSTTPEYLAFGIQDDAPTVKAPSERAGLATVEIISWGASPGEYHVIGELALDEAYVSDVSLTGKAASLKVASFRSSSLVDGLERGDRILVDISANRPMQTGTYVYWNGFAASIASLRPFMGEAGPAVQISEAGHLRQTVAADKIKILGLVVAAWRRM